MKTYVPKPEWLVLDWHHACIDRQTLCIQHCSMCGRWRHPPRRCCPDCFSDSFEFLPAVGAGSVRSLVVSHRSLDPGWDERAPYAVLLVALEEGPSVLAATELDPTGVEIGQPVELSTERRGDSFVLVWANPR
jgi:hypothetical protein